MAVKRTIALLGQPIYNEDGVAAEAIMPGHLVEGVTSISKRATASIATSRTFALERSELGVSGAVGNSIDTAYAIGDTVKIGAFHAGQHVLAFIASGQSITADQKLEPANDGTLKAFSSGTVIARALETSGAVTSLTRLRVEII